MSETTPGETPVERRLREMAEGWRMAGWPDSVAHDADAGREAIALLREMPPSRQMIRFLQWDSTRRALLARCEETR